MRERLLEVLTFEETPFQVCSVVNSYRGHCLHSAGTGQAGGQLREPELL